MYGEVDFAGREGLFDFLGEHALGADHGEGDVGDLVSGGVDTLDFNFVPASTQQCRNVVGLPEGKLGAAGADAKFSGLAVRRSHLRFADETWSFHPTG